MPRRISAARVRQAGKAIVRERFELDDFSHYFKKVIEQIPEIELLQQKVANLETLRHIEQGIERVTSRKEAIQSNSNPWLCGCLPLK